MIIKNSTEETTAAGLNPQRSFTGLPPGTMHLFDQVKRFAAQLRLKSLRQRVKEEETEEEVV